LWMQLNLVGVLFPIPTTQEWSCLKTRSFGFYFCRNKNINTSKQKYKKNQKSFLLTSLN
jgi:hypothetical protein